MRDPRDEATPMFPQRRARPSTGRERAIAELARAQHGVVTLDQLRALGLTASAVRKRVAAGRLHRLHRGVYATDHARLRAEGRWLAAVLVYGEGAVLSHRSAGALWDLRSSSSRRTDITHPGRRPRHRNEVRVHAVAELLADERTRVDGIPCTTVGRTLLDLAKVLDRRGLERTCERAEMLRLFDLPTVEATLDRAAGRHGAALLRSVIDDYRGETLTRSDLEERFLAFCAQWGLPRPRVNVPLSLPDGERYEADFLWDQARLIVETDAYSTHGGHYAFERDRRRDRRLKLVAGVEVVRLTPRQLDREAEQIAADLRARISGEGGIRTLEAA